MKPFGQFAAFSAVENPWPEGSRKVHLTFLRKDSIVSNIVTPVTMLQIILLQLNVL